MSAVLEGLSLEQVRISMIDSHPLPAVVSIQVTTIDLWARARAGPGSARGCCRTALKPRYNV